ncbi:Rab family GTPase [uncultured Nonlabens sp.]|uniref:Rab family GTPase n=1 Tax=uncultured Nonlabens sp. TaxID=859306 RepID=UPI002636E6A7|nr:Rab family GTPase [uncultured Nonlabens sp.]
MTSKKIVIVGSFGVGKTSLIRRFVDETFSEDYKVTIGVHILKKTVDIQKKLVNLIIWDTEGTDDIEEIRKAYLLGTHGFIYVTDITRPKTYENLEAHKTYLNEQFGNVPIIAVGNKTDLLAKGSIAKTKEDMNFLDLLISAKEGNNVQRLFERMAKMLIA